MKQSEKISVLTVSKRTGWELTAATSLIQQTYTNLEWIVVTEQFATTILLRDFATIIQAPEKTQPSGLNAATNEGLRFCRGKYVVFYQDFIELDPDALAMIVADMEATNGLVTTACIDHKGNMDGRYSGNDEFRPVTPNEWEINFGAAPLQAIYDIGGFDERLDAGWSWDNVLVARKADLLGYKTYIDERIKPRLQYHPKEPEVNSQLTPNGERCEEIMSRIYKKQEPIKNDYLL